MAVWISRFMRGNVTVACLAIGTAMSVLTLLLIGVGVMAYPDLLADKVLHGLHMRETSTEAVIVISIDEESESEDRLGRFGKQWRRYHGGLISRLVDDGAKVIGFDLTFPDRSDDDPEFIKGLSYARQHQVPVVIATIHNRKKGTYSKTTEAIRHAVHGVGHAYLPKDALTHLVRYVPLFMEEGSVPGAVVTVVPALTVQMAIAGGLSLDALSEQGHRPVPIVFAGDSSRFQSISYADAYDGKSPSETFRDKFVIIGTEVERHKDSYDVPVESQMPGVVIQANVLNMLLTGFAEAMHPVWLGTIIFGVALIVAVICARIRSRARVTLIVLLLGASWTVSVVLFNQAPPIMLSPAAASIAIMLTWGAISRYEKATLKTKISTSLGLPEDVIMRMERDPAFRQGQAQKYVTVLSTDIVKYSVFTKANDPAHVRDLIGEYMEVMGEIIDRHGGYINKYIGDAILAVFGFPMSESECEKRAVLTAHDMQVALRELVRKWQRENKPCFTDMRIGINSGEVSLSYVGGGKKQLDILGDQVDLAARLEAAAGNDNCMALLSEGTYRLVEEMILSRKVSVTLKNRPDVPYAYTLDGFRS